MWSSFFKSATELKLKGGALHLWNHSRRIWFFFQHLSFYCIFEPLHGMEVFRERSNSRIVSWIYIVQKAVHSHSYLTMTTWWMERDSTLNLLASRGLTVYRKPFNSQNLSVSNRKNGLNRRNQYVSYRTLLSILALLYQTPYPKSPNISEPGIFIIVIYHNHGHNFSVTCGGYW